MNALKHRGFQASACQFLSKQSAAASAARAARKSTSTLPKRERTVAERMNARIKDEFGGRHIWVKGNSKVMSHLIFGLMVLTVDQLMRLLQ
jgi:hypothetical protein